MDQYVLFVILSPSAITVACSVSVYCWRHRNGATARTLAITMGAVLAYLFFNTLELVSPTPEGTLFFAQVCYLFIGMFTVNWLAFALIFTDRQKLLSSRFFRLLWIIPILTIILVFTNSFHHLIWKEYTFLPVGHGFLYMKVITYGSWFWVFWLQSYVLILTGAVMIAWNAITTRQMQKIQARMMLAGALLPLAVNLIYVLRLIPGFQKDYSPLAYAFSGIFFAISIYRYQLLELPLLARAVLIDSMSDGMLTLDSARRVADFNPAAVRIFSGGDQPALKIGERFPLLDEYIHRFDRQAEGDLLETEIILHQAAGEAYYDLQIRRLHDRHDPEGVGYLVSLHAITEHKKLLRSARQMAIEDALTGVLNRRYFIEMARQEMERPRNSPVYFSLLMIDIDYFKQVNDSLGHIGGDQILHAFAQQLRILLRSGDLIGRIGGDEFIVLLPDTRLENARLLAERLCLQVASRPVETENFGAFPITISIGVSEFSPECAPSLEPIILQADKGLYQAKELGRNRVRIFDFSPGLQS